MFRSYRNIVIALVGWLSLAAQHPNPPANAQEAKTANAASQPTENITPSQYAFAERAHRVKYEADCEPANEKRGSDLCAQWKAADATRDAAWWTAWGTLVSGLSGLLVIAALFLAFQSNRIARDSAKRQLRAYCNVSGIEVNGLNVDYEPVFVISVFNTGQTPAKNVKIDSECLIQASGAPIADNAPNLAEHAEVTIGAGRSIGSRAALGRNLTQPEWDGLSSGELNVQVRVYAEYLDIFDDLQSFRAMAYVAGLPNQTIIKPISGTDAAT